MRLHENGYYLIDPNFHDGYLPGIRVLENKTLQLHLTHVDETRYILRITGLEKLKADNFVEGNIILDMSLYTGEAISENTLRELYGDPPIDYDNWFKSVQAKVKAENWSYLEIDATYGCELRAIFSKPLSTFDLVSE